MQVHRLRQLIVDLDAPRQRRLPAHGTAAAAAQQYLSRHAADMNEDQVAAVNRVLDMQVRWCRVSP